MAEPPSPTTVFDIPLIRDRLSDLNKLMTPKMQAELHEHAHRIQEVNSNRAEIWSLFRTCPVPNLTTLRSHCAKNWPANQAATTAQDAARASQAVSA
ncbi:hypothetical protein BGZ52_004938 [Haplosporangium bisporale]|nr:hypothetical protein BGZ52_004938 [Haplosporangium bisporale]